VHGLLRTGNVHGLLRTGNRNKETRIKGKKSMDRRKERIEQEKD
jgi:hypothetical protein